MRHIHKLLLFILLAFGVQGSSCTDRFKPDLNCTVAIKNTKPSAVFVLYDGKEQYGGCQLLSGDSFILPDRPRDGTRHTLTFSYTDPSVYNKPVNFVVHYTSSHICDDLTVNCVVTSSGHVDN